MTNKEYEIEVTKNLLDKFIRICRQDIDDMYRMLRSLQNVEIRDTRKEKSVSAILGNNIGAHINLCTLFYLESNLFEKEYLHDLLFLQEDLMKLIKHILDISSIDNNDMGLMVYKYRYNLLLGYNRDYEAYKSPSKWKRTTPEQILDDMNEAIKESKGEEIGHRGMGGSFFPD